MTVTLSDEYSEFVSDNRDMRISLLAVKEQLIQWELPAQYFISVVKYRTDLKIAHGPNELNYHIIENLKSMHNEGYSEHVLIGWC